MADVLKYSEVKDWDVNKIDAKVGELRRELFSLKMQKAAAGVEKPHRFKTIKSDIARLLTAKNIKK